MSAGRSTIVSQDLDRLIRSEYREGESIRRLILRLKSMGAEPSERTLRRYIVSRQIAPAIRPGDDVRPDRVPPPWPAQPRPVAEAESVSVTSEEADELGSPERVRARLRWVGGLIDRVLPIADEGDSRAVTSLQKLLRIEGDLSITLRALTPRVEAETEEMLRLGEEARERLIADARARAEQARRASESAPAPSERR